MFVVCKDDSCCPMTSYNLYFREFYNIPLPSVKYVLFRLFLPVSVDRTLWSSKSIALLGHDPVTRYRKLCTYTETQGQSCSFICLRQDQSYGSMDTNPIHSPYTYNTRQPENMNSDSDALLANNTRYFIVNKKIRWTKKWKLRMHLVLSCS